MNPATINVSQADAILALKEYKQARGSYDTRDWEIERIYRAIAKGKKVISAIDAIVAAGLDEMKRPKLAIAPASLKFVECERANNRVLFEKPWGRGATGKFEVPWPGMVYASRIAARLPRIPPQYRPANLAAYHLLWEADWSSIPRDPLLLKQLSKDAFVVVAAWDLTDVEMNVMRAHTVRP